MNKKLSFIVSVIALVFISVQSMGQATKWVVDKGHSNVKFTVTHYAVSEVEGNFKIFDGTMEHTKADFTDAKVAFYR